MFIHHAITTSLVIQRGGKDRLAILNRLVTHTKRATMQEEGPVETFSLQILTVAVILEANVCLRHSNLFQHSVSR